MTTLQDLEYNLARAKTIVNNLADIGPIQLGLKNVHTQEGIDLRLKNLQESKDAAAIALKEAQNKLNEFLGQTTTEFTSTVKPLIPSADNQFGKISPLLLFGGLVAAVLIIK